MLTVVVSLRAPMYFLMPVPPPAILPDLLGCWQLGWFRCKTRTKSEYIRIRLTKKETPQSKRKKETNQWQSLYTGKTSVWWRHHSSPSCIFHFKVIKKDNQWTEIACVALEKQKTKMITSNTERKRKTRNFIKTELGKAPIRLAKPKLTSPKSRAFRDDRSRREDRNVRRHSLNITATKQSWKMEIWREARRCDWRLWSE
jgi:hypothetical protein